MPARYRVLLADPLLKMGLQWPPGVRLVEQLERGTVGTHWWLFEDPEAPEDLEGREVELTLMRARGVARGGGEPLGDGVPVITQRRVIVTHLVPQDDSGEMPCCGLPAWEKPGPDRLTEDKGLVTCGGGAQ